MTSRSSRRCGAWQASIRGTGIVGFDLPATRGARHERGPGPSPLFVRRVCRCPAAGRADEWRTVAHGQFPPTARNHVWAYDFVFDACANGQTLKCLTVVDEWTRECLAIDVAGGIRSGRVIAVLTRLVSLHGTPRYLRSDNGPGFVATAILRWLTDAQIETAHIDPGKPWENATDESFNGKFRDEHLRLRWFRSRVEAKVGIEQWRQHYNDVRPHSSLGYLTPTDLKATQLSTTDDGGARWRCQLALTKKNTETNE